MCYGHSVAATQSIAKASEPAERYGYRIIRTLPHSAQSFTQGLSIESDMLWESSGLYRRSFVQRRSKYSPEPLAQFRFPARHFAEGIVVYGDYLYGLTWKSGTVYRWHKNDLEMDKQFTIAGQGWGLAQWQQQLITSDGSDTLSFRSPDDLRVLRRISVTLNGRAVYQLNDLSSDPFGIWANVWHQNHLLHIAPDTGRVMGVLDLDALAKTNQSGNFENVLNGVAWDSSTDTLWVTGKHWQNLYQLQIKHQKR